MQSDDIVLKGEIETDKGMSNQKIGNRKQERGKAIAAIGYRLEVGGKGYAENHQSSIINHQSDAVR